MFSFGSVIPYLSTDTALVCDTTRSTTAVDARFDRWSVNGRRSNHKLYVQMHNVEAECITTHAWGPCTIRLNNEKIPTVSSLTSLSLRSVVSGDEITYRGDRLRRKFISILGTLTRLLNTYTNFFIFLFNHLLYCHLLYCHLLHRHLLLSSLG